MKTIFIPILCIIWFANSKIACNTARKHEALANAFKPLDGYWQGTFYIYHSPLGQLQKPVQPEGITQSLIQNLGLKLSDSLEVHQHYFSESPWMQTVVIEDIYNTQTGELKMIKSHGFNKIEDGELICVVNKPDEKIVHSGILVDSTTIIWTRHEKDPLRLERFEERVSDTTYTILGWGYYGGDNIRLSPSTWFIGKYVRSELQ